MAPDLPYQLCCKVRREGYGGEVNKLDQSNCFTGPLESERREERDITLSEFNILLSDTDRTFELSVDMAESLGAADDPPSLLKGGSLSMGTGFLSVSSPYHRHQLHFPQRKEGVFSVNIPD